MIKVKFNGVEKQFETREAYLEAVKEAYRTGFPTITDLVEYDDIPLDIDDYFVNDDQVEELSQADFKRLLDDKLAAFTKNANKYNNADDEEVLNELETIEKFKANVVNIEKNLTAYQDYLINLRSIKPKKTASEAVNDFKKSDVTKDFEKKTGNKIDEKPEASQKKADTFEKYQKVFDKLVDATAPTIKNICNELGLDAEKTIEQLKKPLSITELDKKVENVSLADALEEWNNIWKNIHK